MFLEERVEAFLGSFLEQLKTMSDTDFDARRRGLIVKKLEKAKNLAEESGDYWGQIRFGYYNFSQGELHRCGSRGRSIIIGTVRRNRCGCTRNRHQGADGRYL